MGGGDLLGPRGQERRGGDVGGQALQVARAVLRLGAGASGLGRGGDALRSQQDSESSTGGVGVVRIRALEAVEAVGAEDRAGDQALGEIFASSSDPGSSQASEVASQLGGLLGRQRRRDPYALGVQVTRACRGRRRGRAAGRSGCSIASFLKPALGVGRAGRRGKLAGQLLALEEPDDEQVGLDVGRLDLADVDLHECASLCVAHGGSRLRLPLSSRLGQAALSSSRDPA